MDTIAKKAGLEGKYSNYSGKRTCATALYQAGVDEQEIMSRTGHRSEKAVRKYKMPCAEVIKKTSAVLDPPPEKRIKREAGMATSASAPVKGVELETENDENIAAIEKAVPKRAVCDRKLEVKQKLMDITNRIGPSSDSMVFSNCTFNM